MRTWDVTFRTTVELESREIISILAKCYALASVINNIPITPNRLNKLEKLNILRAVRGTTGIEGAELTEDEVRRIMASPKRIPALPLNRQREEKEARNADTLMRYVARLVDRTLGCILDENVIRNFHKILTKDIEYEQNTPGEYRRFPVSVGSYIPPREEKQIKGLMAGFISWFNQGEPKELDPIVRAIVAHFYVVSIHPFGDGNGRTSRAVESFLLYKAGINARGFYSLANYYYQHRSEYIHYLDTVRNETGNDLTPFVLFALKGLASELEEVHKEVLSEVREIAFRDYVRDVFSEGLTSKPGNRMFDFMILLGFEPVSIKSIRDGKHALGQLYRGLTSKTLSRDLEVLSKKRLIVIKEGQIKANLSIMGEYTAHRELVRQSDTVDSIP